MISAGPTLTRAGRATEGAPITANGLPQVRLGGDHDETAVPTKRRCLRDRGQLPTNRTPRRDCFDSAGPLRTLNRGDNRMGSVVKKRRKRMAKKKHRKLLRKTRVQRRRLGK